jgi:hypothetical protein
VNVRKETLTVTLMDFDETIRRNMCTKILLDIQTRETMVHRSIINLYETHL